MKLLFGVLGAFVLLGLYFAWPGEQDPESMTPLENLAPEKPAVLPSSEPLVDLGVRDASERSQVPGSKTVVGGASNASPLESDFSFVDTPNGLAPTQKIYGRVMDQSGQPIAGVRLEGMEAAHVLTDEKGEFALECLRNFVGHSSLLLRADGYTDLQLNPISELDPLMRPGAWEGKRMLITLRKTTTVRTRVLAQPGQELPKTVRLEYQLGSSMVDYLNQQPCLAMILPIAPEPVGKDGAGNYVTHGLPARAQSAAVVVGGFGQVTARSESFGPLAGPGESSEFTWVLPAGPEQVIEPKPDRDAILKGTVRLGEWRVSGTLHWELPSPSGIPIDSGEIPIRNGRYRGKAPHGILSVRTSDWEVDERKVVDFLPIDVRMGKSQEVDTSGHRPVSRDFRWPMEFGSIQGRLVQGPERLPVSHHMVQLSYESYRDQIRTRENGDFRFEVPMEGAYALVATCGGSSQEKGTVFPGQSVVPEMDEFQALMIGVKFPPMPKTPKDWVSAGIYWRTHGTAAWHLLDVVSPGGSLIRPNSLIRGPIDVLVLGERNGLQPYRLLNYENTGGYLRVPLKVGGMIECNVLPWLDSLGEDPLAKGDFALFSEEEVGLLHWPPVLGHHGPWFQAMECVLPEESLQRRVIKPWDDGRFLARGLAPGKYRVYSCATGKPVQGGVSTPYVLPQGGALRLLVR